MASKKKKESELSYLQMPLPQGQKKSKMTKLDWSGINYRNTKDSGEISKEINISTFCAPYLIPSRKPEKVIGVTPEEGYTPNQIFPYENLLIVQETAKGNENVKVNGVVSYRTCVVRYRYKVFDSDFKLIATENLTEYSKPEYTGAGVTAFRGFENYSNIANIGSFTKILFFPAAYSMKFDDVKVLEEHFDDYSADDRKKYFTNYINAHCQNRNTQYYIKCAECHDGINSRLRYDDRISLDKDRPWLRWVTDSDGNADLSGGAEYEIDKAEKIDGVPKLHYVCTAHQRLFGIDEGRVFASGYNDYANWNLDTVDDFSADNAWMSSTQSGNGGENTGIAAYGGSVFVFKKDCTFEIVNTKNPFRITEAFPVGAIGQRAIQVVGSFLIFVSEDSVMLYNGTALKNIGYKLNIDRFREAVTGGDGRNFYLYCTTGYGEKRLFVYDTLTGLWGEEAVESEIVGFSKNNLGMYALTGEGEIYRLDTENYNHDWFIETDFFTNNSVDIKHIKKVQMLADIYSGSIVRAYILYDGEKFDREKAHLIFEKENTGDKAVKLPIRVLPRRTASYGFKIRIEGTGYAKLYQMELGLTGGGEKYVSE